MELFPLLYVAALSFFVAACNYTTHNTQWAYYGHVSIKTHFEALLCMDQREAVGFHPGNLDTSWLFVDVQSFF